MYELLKIFFDICLFKKGPEDIPVSMSLLYFLLPIYACTSFLILILNTDVTNAILQIGIEIVLILSFCRIILYLAKKTERYVQTACAIVATDSIISFFAIPVMGSLLVEGSALSFFSIVLLMLWQWNISGFIFAKALSQTFTFGLGVSFVYILVSYQLMTLLFPEIIVME